MGYLSYFSGSIDIDPPLVYRELRELKDLSDLQIRVQQTRTDTDEGWIITPQGLSIEPACEDRYKGYEIQKELQRIVTTCPDHKYTGYILREGEDSGDITRLIVVDGEAKEQQATFTFPEE